MSPRRRRIFLILKLLVAVGFILWLVRSGKIDVREIKKVGEGWPWLAAALVPYGLVLGLCAYRWKLLLKAQDIDYSTHDAFALTMVGHFFNQFLLGTTGGDVVKAYSLAMEQRGKRSAAVMSVFVDRAVGLLVLVGVALLAIPFNLERILAHPYLRYLAGMVVCVFVGSLVAGYFFFSARIRSLRLVRSLLERLPLRKVAGQISQAIYVYKLHPRVVIAAVLSSLGVHVLVVLMHLLLARALCSEEISWGAFFFLVPIAQIAIAIPLQPPGALGTGEWVYATLLPMAGVPENQGALVCILQRLVYYAWALLGCAYYLRRRARVDQAVHEAEVDDEARQGAEDSLADRPGGLGGDADPSHGDRGVRPRVDSSAV